MDDGPIIVFSDTHFGFEADSARRFRNFLLTWLKPLVNAKSAEITSSCGKKTLKEPSKIILIGDILELLAPRKGDATLALRESFDIFNLLVALKKELIYVSGNHDDEVGDYVDGEIIYVSGNHDDEVGDYRDDSCCGGDYVFKNGCQLTVYPDHYPVNGSDKLGKKIGGKTYYFFHGHQFDSVWGPPFVRKLGVFIAQSSTGIRHWKLFNVTGFATLLVTIILFFVLLPLGIDWISWFAGLLVQWPILMLIPFFWGFFVFLSFIWISGRLAQSYYHTTCPGYPSKLRDAEIETVRRVAGGNFKKEINSIYADVIVFGHTHAPEKCYDEETKKQLCNAGSWITHGDPKADCGWIGRVRFAVKNLKSQKPDKREIHDTFVYIDRDGPLLLQWDDDKNCVRELPTKDHCPE